MRRMIEAEKVQKIGGLTRDERSMRGIHEVVECAVPALEAFTEAINGRRSMKRWLANAITACGSLREANAEATLGFLIRKGVQNIANEFYTGQPQTFREYANVVASNNLAEWYAPLYGSDVAQPVEAGDQFQEMKVQGEDYNLVNRKFGRMVSFERELFDDDQTGQIKARAGRLGDGMATLQSIWAASKFIGAARTYASVTVPAVTYSTTNTAGSTISTPFSTTLYTASAGNRPSTYLQLNMGNMKTAYTALKNAVDPFGVKIVVKIDTLLVSNQDILNADMLLAPGNYPAVPGQSGAVAASAPVIGGTTSAAGANQGVLAGFPGGAFAANPLGRLGIKQVTETYFPDWAWALMEGKKGFIMQERDPMEVAQEATNAGAAFNFDVIRYRSRARFEFGWINGSSRFAYLGNSGDVTGQQ